MKPQAEESHYNKSRTHPTVYAILNFVQYDRVAVKTGYFVILKLPKTVEESPTRQLFILRFALVLMRFLALLGMTELR